MRHDDSNAKRAWFDSRLRAEGASASLAEAGPSIRMPAEAGLTMSAHPELCRRMRTLRSLRSIVLAAAILWLAAAPVAHDLERTQVLITFERDGSFVLDIANDPSWLKLRLERFPDSFDNRVVLWVDGREVRPTSVELIPGPTVATHRLRGRMPSGARTLRWYYGLVIDPYPLAVRRADGRVVIEEIAGDAWSGTIDLSGQFRAPILSSTMVGVVLAGLLLVPVAIRLATKTRRHEKPNRFSFVLSWFGG
jgi:hypothetical protein